MSFRTFAFIFASLIATASLAFSSAAIAATPKKTSTPSTSPAARPTATGGDTLISTAPGSGSQMPEFISGHLSLGGVYDFADSFEISGGQKADSEKAFNVLAQYELDQFSPGVAAQFGGTYDFSREVKNAGGLKVQEWTAYGELVGKLTPQLKVFGGVNYNFPNLTNAAQGASIKGKVAFQGGASYQINSHFAADARYRMLEMETSGPNGAGGTTTTTVKLSGFMFGGRYIF